MPFVDSLSKSTSPENAGGTSKQEILVDFQEFLFPEVFFVQYIRAENFCCYATSQVFKTFACEASFNRSEVL